MIFRKKRFEMNLIRKSSADKLFDDYLIIWQSDPKLQKQYPNLENETKFHRNNYYKVIDQLK